MIAIDAGQALALPRALPAVQRPDATDWGASPNSFGTTTVELLGQDGCEELLISTAPVQTYRFTQIRQGPVEIETLDRAPQGPCDDQDAGDVTPLCIRRGALVQYETSFIPAGHGLGEVLYSLPLAPCELVKIAMIEWQRSDTTSRTEATGVTETVAHEQRRDRSIDEIVEGTLSEWQRGGTVMGAVAGAYSSGNASISGSLGASYSTSSGDRRAPRRPSIGSPIRSSRQAPMPANCTAR